MDSHLTAAEIISIPFGKVCTEMRDLELHKYVKKVGSRKGYSAFPDWIQSVTNGKLSKGSLYMAMGLHKLTEGPNAIPAEEVVQMPKENAYRLSTLQPEQRTPDLVDAAKKTPKEKFPKRVQEKLNEGKLPADQVPVKSIFHRELDFNICNMLEDAIEEFTLLEVVRDGDRALTLQEKAIAAIVTSARTHCADLLDASRRKREKEHAAAPVVSEAEHEAVEANSVEAEPEADLSVPDEEEREILRETEYVPIEEAEASSEL
jgi:hypothetical protein